MIASDLINPWPGQDGYDYCFQADYSRERDWFADCVKECCRHRRDVRVAVEYRSKEPRNRSYVSNVSTALLMASANSTFRFQVTQRPFTRARGPSIPP